MHVDRHDQADDQDDSAPDPAAMMSLLTEQQRRVDAAQLAPIPWLYAIWGVAWLIGYAVLWSAWEGGNPWFRIPGVAAGVAFGVLIVASTVASIVVSTRINRGVQTLSSFQGAVYGISWSLSGFATFALGAGLAFNGMSSELVSVYFPSAFGLTVGTLYLGGAALWKDKGQLVLGIALLAISVIAPFAGQPTNNLVIAIGGGGAFLIGALTTQLRIRSAR